jgi:hypothetical protein
MLPTVTEVMHICRRRFLEALYFYGAVRKWVFAIIDVAGPGKVWIGVCKEWTIGIPGFGILEGRVSKRDDFRNRRRR